MITWQELEAGVLTTVLGLTDRSKLVISDTVSPSAYVQFEQDTDELRLRTSSDVPDGEGVSSSSIGVALSGFGLSITSRSGSNVGWNLALTWPLRWAQYMWMTSVGVTILRDLHRVSEPSQLEYRAWREPEPPPRGVTFYEEDLEPGDPHVELPALGLRDATLGIW